MSHTDEQKQWIEFYDRMADGKIPYNSNVYFVDDYISQEGGASNVQLITPTQSQVQQARMQLKRKIVSKIPKRGLVIKRKMNQKGGSKKKKKCGSKKSKKRASRKRL